ncbi:uncharacterized protein LOC144869459 [Branchiostoma floridae x Branchiostoma japonicum]
MAGKSAVTMVMAVSLVVLMRDPAGVSSAPAKTQLTLETLDARLGKAEKQLSSFEKIAYGPALDEAKESVAVVDGKLKQVDTRVTALESIVLENQEAVEEQNAAFQERLGKLETDMQGTKEEMNSFKNVETKIQNLDDGQKSLQAAIAAYDEKMEVLELVEPMMERVQGLENKVVSGAQLHENPKSVVGGDTSSDADSSSVSSGGFDIEAFMAQIHEALQDMVETVVGQTIGELPPDLSGESETLDVGCLVRDGAFYRGNINVTSTGRTCQRWDSQEPHQHIYTQYQLPNAGLDENYCRNPDEAATLWCFTTDPVMRWDWCTPPLCDPCPDNQTQCGDGECVPDSKVCNVYLDCVDWYDELYCENQETGDEYTTAIPDAVTEGCLYTCDGDKCLPLARWCNGKPDCEDGADEAKCDYNGCSEEQFTCANGGCIHGGWRCDGVADCSDSSDEVDCPVETGDEFACASDEFACDEEEDEGLQCIHESWVCDGYHDCEDNADEEDCQCSTTEFLCANGEKCIPGTWHCDSDADCADGSDEVDCPERESDRFTCASNGENFPIGFQCDNMNDCEDGSDEVGCNITMSCVNRFRCDSGYCIPEIWHCDNKVDCADESDEKDCEGDESPYYSAYCFSFEFKCVGSGLCIDGHQRCDDREDCDDGSDEEGCGICNEPDTFTCGNGQCVYESQMCDDVQHCTNGMDEIGCGSSLSLVSSCEAPSFQCTSSSRCIPGSWVCDGFKDCGEDVEDEANCHHMVCDYWRFKCESTGGCAMPSMRCDGQKDCPNGEDEQDCDNYPG